MAEISLHRPFPADAVEHWDFTTDVAVIGFGAAGACAAIEAADAGAKVMLFERNSGSGGASGLSGGEIYIGGGGGTDAQRAAGFEDTTEDFIAYLKAAGGPCDHVAQLKLLVQDQTAVLGRDLSNGRGAHRRRGDRASETDPRGFRHCSCPCWGKRHNSLRSGRPCRPGDRGLR